MIGTAPGQQGLQVPVNRVERRAVAHKAGFTHGKPVYQGRPFNGPGRPLGHMLVKGLIATHLELTHARAQTGLQEHLALVVDANTGPRLKQHLPLMELFSIHLRQLLQ